MAARLRMAAPTSLLYSAPIKQTHAPLVGFPVVRQNESPAQRVMHGRGLGNPRWILGERKGGLRRKNTWARQMFLLEPASKFLQAGYALPPLQPAPSPLARNYPPAYYVSHAIWRNGRWKNENKNGGCCKFVTAFGADYIGAILRQL